MKSLCILFINLCFAYFVKSDVDVRCSESFCDSYIATTGCPSLGDACRIQNSTHNGLILDSATPCNCCETCLTYLVEDDICAVGQPGAPPPKSMCGPGLYCTPSTNDDEHPTCKPMAGGSSCYQEQIAYDARRKAGKTGTLEVRPKCDGSGFYEPVKCVPGQICYCLSKDGRRIFGEAFHSHSTELTMQCECSRLVDKANTLLSIQERPVGSSRCSSTGSYESLQCIGDICVCVDVITGAPMTVAVNKTSSNIAELDCFDPDVHDNETYYNPCEVQQLTILQEIDEYEEEGYSVLDFQFNLCQYDGWYARVQTREHEKVCVDKYGKQIENFKADVNSDAGRAMDCNCARTYELLKEQSSELPQCCSNGNFPSITCRRGICYCTDANGQQLPDKPEVVRGQEALLPCQNPVYC